ncbi:hypothetical protein [Streptomyces sp. MUM 16J]|uniref:hypothetical protein n=1 Tax=Streptomyces sp. MUM 16J TaxID=2791988 RepID=UPI001F0496D5|nr:hypothetical protein [Streptomyces sp. MUM 16J]MCH0555825.1 hypothetical protein [Streptomyces sp. MUM 16J]
MSDSTGVAAVDSAAAWAVAVVAVAGLGTLLWKLLRAVLRIADRVDEAWEDWTGADARPGVPARPGVMARLGDHDDRLDEHEQRITRVESQTPHSGTTP